MSDDLAAKAQGWEALQVDMDPVRLAAACMALSCANGLLKAEVEMLRRELKGLRAETGNLRVEG